MTAEEFRHQQEAEALAVENYADWCARNFPAADDDGKMLTQGVEEVYLIEEEGPSEDFMESLELLARFVRLTSRIELERVGEIAMDIATWADGLGTEAKLFLDRYDIDGVRKEIKE